MAMWEKVDSQSFDGGHVEKAEEYEGAGISLERDSILGAFSTTFGIYGFGFHTVIYSTLESALIDYEKMKQEYQDCIEVFSSKYDDTTTNDVVNDYFCEWFSDFVDRHESQDDVNSRPPIQFVD